MTSQRQQAKTNAANLRAARTALLKVFPDAAFARLEDKCPSCKVGGAFVSFIFQHDPITEDGAKENCGYFCARCGWSNAGSRIAGDTP